VKQPLRRRLPTLKERSNLIGRIPTPTPHQASYSYSMDEAICHARTAIKLAAGSDHAAMFASFVLASRQDGKSDRGDTQSELSPYYLGQLSNAYRLLRKTEEAIAALKAYDAPRWRRVVAHRNAASPC
jgi:hypothetical protein